MVAQLVGEHSGELRPRQAIDRERRHDDEVSAAGEGVELRRWQDPHHEIVRLQVVAVRQRGPHRTDDVELARVGSPCTEQRRQHRDLDGADEQQRAEREPRRRQHPERDVPKQPQWEPQDHHGHQPERHQGGDRQERGDGRALQLTTPVAHPRHTTAQDTEPRHTREMTPAGSLERGVSRFPRQLSAREVDVGARPTTAR